MIEKILHVLTVFSDLIWAWPAFTVLLASGLFLSIRMQLVQLRCFLKGGRLLLSKEKDGGVSPFQALSTALSGTIGTGNIAGVATAITLGGPGAIFWMWVMGFLGMSIKFCSCTLAAYYRDNDSYPPQGGPMYTLYKGANQHGLAVCFSVATLFASFGTGAMVQANSIASGLSYFVPMAGNGQLFAGITLALLCAIVIIGGVKRIANVAAVLVPFMSVSYCALGLCLLFFNYERLPNAIYLIFNGGLNISALGAASIGVAIHYGVARALFASEAGLGTAAMAQSVADNKHPVEAGYAAMLGPFIDTLTICTMTALVILSSGVLDSAHLSSMTGATLSIAAFESSISALGNGFGHLAGVLVAGSLVIFAYTTIIAWGYYGQLAMNYLFSGRFITVYRLIYLMLLVLGAVVPLELVWEFADIANFFMVLPNLIGIFLLLPTLKQLVEEYNKRH